MHILHGAFDSDPELNGTITNLSERIGHNWLKAGIILDFNPFWLAAYRAVEAGLDEQALWISNWASNVSGRLPWTLNARPTLGDLKQRFAIADQLTTQAFGRSFPVFQPYLVRIILHATNEGTSDEGSRRAILAIAKETTIPVVIETRPEAHLVAKAGDRFTSASGTRGTIGGFVRDAFSGRAYGMTCGHVVTSGVVRDGKGVVGPCLHALPPVVHPKGIHCHASCPTITRAELALVEVSSFVAGPITPTVALHVVNDDLVTMRLASGEVEYAVGGAVIEHTIGGACWTRLVQINAPIMSGIVPAAARVALTPLPKDGDSGAWLFRNKTEWAGMVVASDGLHGYALAATTLVAEGNRAFGLNLVPA